MRWLAPRHFDIIMTTLYMGILVIGSVEGDTTLPDQMLTLGGLLLGLAVLDRIEFAVFRERPAWWVGGLLLAARIATIAVLVGWVGIWAATFLVVIVPYWCTLYFGDRSRYITWALTVVLVGLLLLGETLERAQREPLDAVLGDYLSSILPVAFVLGVVAATSRTVVKETAGRARVEKVLGELREAHAALAEFFRQALDAGEARNSLARDIHDGLGHYLTAMSIQLENAIAFRNIDPAAADQAMHESKRLVAVALQEIRSTMGALRESEGELSLVKSLLELAELAQYTGQGGLQVHLTIEGSEVGYSRQALMTIYRAAQEGLTNIQKHAGAGQVDMRLEFGDEIAKLEIRDDGTGFAPEAVRAMTEQAGHGVEGKRQGQGQGGYGLQSMRERLELIGGELRVVSKPGGGTELHIHVPKRSPSPARQPRAAGHDMEVAETSA